MAFAWLVLVVQCR